jgi:hypothetical protein
MYGFTFHSQRKQGALVPQNVSTRLRQFCMEFLKAKGLVNSTHRCKGNHYQTSVFVDLISLIECNVLKAEKGCTLQVRHMDYSPTDVKNILRKH